MSAIEQQTIQVNGIQLSLHIAGPESGPPVWLLHGFPECWHSWRQQIPCWQPPGIAYLCLKCGAMGAVARPPRLPTTTC